MDPNGKHVLTAAVTSDGTIVVAGDIDMAGGPLLEEAILARETDLERASSGDVVLDLENVHFIDSSGLRGLLGASRRAASRRSAVVLRAAGPEIIRLLEITGTLDQFNIVSRRD
jgi:anti-sigma B factor antagonist